MDIKKEYERWLENATADANVAAELKTLDENGGKLSYTLNGTLYPDEQVVIYDIGDVKPEAEKKRRGRRKKSEIEAEQKEN